MIVFRLRKPGDPTRAQITINALPPHPKYLQDGQCGSALGTSIVAVEAYGVTNELNNCSKDHDCLVAVKFCVEQVVNGAEDTESESNGTKEHRPGVVGPVLDDVHVRGKVGVGSCCSHLTEQAGANCCQERSVLQGALRHDRPRSKKSFKEDS